MQSLSLQYCFQGRRSAGDQIGRHTHHGCELVYYAAGTGSLQLDGEEMTIAPGMLCLIHPDTPHSETWQEAGDVRCIIMDIDEEQRLPEGLYRDLDDEILPLVEAFFLEQQHDRPGREEISRRYLALILALMARLESQPSRRPLPSGDRLDSICRFIQDYYMTDIAFDELALSIGYSYDRFRHLFKARYHVSPTQMVQARRIARAKELLRASDEKIENIAALCGYSSPSQFNVIFKKYRGMTPREYRNNMQKKQG